MSRTHTLSAQCCAADTRRREKVVLGLEPGSPAYEQLHARGSPIALLFGSRDADARDLLAALMRIDPAARLTAAQALAHPWFSGM
jgi:hypothetical protein